MTKRFEGKVAFITGAARGQGRSHAIRLAEEGADVIAIDICDQIDTVNYPMAQPHDLDETAELVADAGGKVIAEQADVRDLAAMQDILRRGVDTLGPIDFVLANAGILPGIGAERPPVAAFVDGVDVMLKGVYYTIEAALPSMLDNDTGGSIVITSSSIAQKSVLSPTVRSMNHGVAGYTAAKAGLIGLMHYYARALAEKNIRVNSIHPTAVNTPMVTDTAVENHWNRYPEIFTAVQNALPGVGLIESSDVTEAVLYLLGESGRYVTGVALPVDAGFLIR